MRCPRRPAEEAVARVLVLEPCGPHARAQLLTSAALGSTTVQRLRPTTPSGADGTPSAPVEAPADGARVELDRAIETRGDDLDRAKPQPSREDGPRCAVPGSEEVVIQETIGPGIGAGAQMFSSRSIRGSSLPARTASSWAAKDSPTKSATELRKLQSSTPIVPASGP